MKQYLEMFPKERNIVFSLINGFDYDKAEAICLKALKENKKIELITDDNLIDFLDYKLV